MERILKRTGLKSRLTRIFAWVVTGILILFAHVTNLTGGGVTVSTIPNVRVWITTVDQNYLLQEVSIDKPLTTIFQRELKVVVEPNRRYQVMDGFGASLTDASAYLIYHKLNSDEREKLMKKLFDRNEGIGISFLRQPMGATDYTTKLYSYCDLPEGVKDDPELRYFSIDHDRAYIIPLLKMAMQINPELKIMASPWSPPGWMKTSGSMIGGSLLREYYKTYALYFVKFVKEYEKEGIPIYAITPQNEPLYVPREYPGMRMSWEEQADFIGEYLGPAFEREGIKTKILTYDHNWDNIIYAAYVLSHPKASKYVAGSAWHFYGGSHETMTKIKEMFPDKEIWFTEGSGGDWVPAFFQAFMDQMMHVIRIPRNWSKTVVWWNIALDERRGPTILSKSTCRGLVEINSQTGEVKFNVDYYTLGHISKFVRPGAYRIGSYTYSELETVAFENPDGSRVLIVSNRTNTSKKLLVDDGSFEFSYILPGYAAATFVWRVKN